MLNKRTIEDIDLKDKRALVRCDFNVPLNDAGVITDDKRITASLPTIRYLLDAGASVVLCSHLGRPKGEPDPKYSLKPVAKRLAELLNVPVHMADDVTGPDAQHKLNALKPGECLLLENVRFVKGETKNDPGFSKELAAFGDVFVNDAFGSAHRAHSSTTGVADYLPAVCGYLIQKEIDIMGRALNDPARPFVAILGGAKVSDKIGVINNLLEKVDKLIIGGAMAYTFIAAKGGSIGASLCEQDKLDLAKELMAKAQVKGVDMLLPKDNIAADKFAADAQSIVTESMDVPDGWQGLDIGPETIKLFCGAIKGASTVVWNGPMGVFEFPRFAEGTKAIARAIAETDCVSIIGGGDSAAAVEQLGFADSMTHISTGGGASLEFLEGLELPGIACLMDK